MTNLAALCTTIVGKILLAIIVWFVGKFVVRKIVGLVGKIKALEKIEPNTRTFVLSAVKWLLYIVLVVSIVAIAGGLGVIIPPSIPFIWYGLTANESVSSLFLAGSSPSRTAPSRNALSRNEAVNPRRVH